MCPPPEDADLAELFTPKSSRTRVNCGEVEGGAGSSIRGAPIMMLGAVVGGKLPAKTVQNSTGGSEGERKGTRVHSDCISWE